jgi:hypothetical protein
MGSLPWNFSFYMGEAAMDCLTGVVLDIVEVHHRVLLAVDIASPHVAHQAVVVEISARSIGSGMPQGMYGSQ